VRAILGRWWVEGSEVVFTWSKGKLQAEQVGAAPWSEPAVFEEIGPGEYRSVAGRERGERLRVDGDTLVWSGYVFTRDQRTF